MSKIYKYQLVLGYSGIIDAVLEELHNKGFCLPEADFYSLIENEPFKTLDEMVPERYGRGENIFNQASPWVDGLRLDLYSLMETDLPCGELDKMIIDIGTAVISEWEIENLAKTLSPEQILAQDSVHFQDREGIKRDIIYVAYTK